MKLKIETQNPMTDEAIKAATGKTWSEWFDYLDGKDGKNMGRRNMGNHLYAELKLDAWWAPTVTNEYEVSRGIVEKDGRPKGYGICCTKTISAPVEACYAAWVEAGTLEKWFGTGCKVSAEEGGEFSSADGDKATFKRVRPNKDLRFTYERDGITPDTIVDVSFTDNGKGKTGLLVNHDRILKRAEADALREGWGEALTRLKSLLEG